MQRICGIICSFLLVILTACGGNVTERDVIQDLTDRNKELESYQSHGKMKIHNGQEPITYDVEVWYKKPNFYRVVIKNVKKDITQVLLRNKEGVFVLTPHLKKSFRFQSDWPKANGQVYLYQTLLNSIITDKTRKYQVQKKQYQFDVTSASTQNSIMPKQRIWLDKDLYPKKVSVFDQGNKEMISVIFDRFKENPAFDGDAFDRTRNMNQVTLSHKATTAMANQNKSQDAIAPAYVPAGSSLQLEHRFKSVNGPATIMRYGGKQPFSLTVRKSDMEASESPHKGQPVHLENTVGVMLLNGQQHHLTWFSKGMEYELIGKLATEEMIKIANTTFEPEGK